jgi:ketosteroid isomerase-like protein
LSATVLPNTCYGSAARVSMQRVRSRALAYPVRPVRPRSASAAATFPVPRRHDESRRLVTQAILNAAMSENVAVARRWVELYNDRGDVAEFLSLLDPEVELQTPGGPRLRGHDEARDWFEKESENVQSRIIADRFVEDGDVVAGLGRTEVRWTESREIAHEFESAGVFWFRNRKIVRWRPFETHDAALKAAGLT